MSLNYGLNVKRTVSVPARKTILDDEDEEDEPPSTDNLEEITTVGTTEFNNPAKRPLNAPNPPQPRKLAQEDRRDLSSEQAAKSQVQAAQTLDASIFDYDTFHDAKTSVSEAKKEAEKADAIARKPKYINNLLDAAARRKQDQQVAREKFLQREREAEGEEFADKEKFVTGAYKEQQAETRKLEEEEKRKAEVEERRKRMLGGGMQGFYRGMMDQQEKQRQGAVEAAELIEREGPVTGDAGNKVEQSDAQLAEELKAKGVNVHVNEEGLITDKRELLSAGLNVGVSGKTKNAHGSDHLKTSARPLQSAFANRNAASRDAQRERQSKMMEEQLAQQAKRAREEEDEERQKAENAAKSAKSSTDVNDAKARYLARKAAKERGEG